MLNTKEVVVVAIITAILTFLGTTYFKDKQSSSGAIPSNNSGENVVRFVDTEHGNVCYILRSAVYWRSASISCVKQK